MIIKLLRQKTKKEELPHMRNFPKISAVIFCLVILLICLGGLATNVFGAEWNITGSTFSHDPTIIRESGLWWQFYTADGIGVKYSSDGKHWNQGVQIFSSPLCGGKLRA